MADQESFLWVRGPFNGRTSQQFFTNFGGPLRRSRFFSSSGGVEAGRIKVHLVAMNMHCFLRSCLNAIYVPGFGRNDEKAFMVNLAQCRV